MKTYDLKELSTATSKMPKTGGAFTGAVTSNSNVTTTGTVTANKLVKSGGTSSQLLLANGDSKATSDFATSGHNHDNTYLKLAGGTLTGAVSSNSNITSSANLTGAKIIKSGGTNAQLLLANGDSKATSDFATSGHNHDNTYLKLSGGTLTGAVSSNSNVTTTGTVTANKLVKSGGTSSQLLLANGDSKATSDFATSGHGHGYVTTDGKLSNSNSAFADWDNVYQNCPLVADAKDSAKIKMGVIGNQFVMSPLSIPSLNVDIGTSQTEINTKIAEKLNYGWKNVTVDGSGNLVNYNELNGVRYRQFVNSSGMSIITLRGELTTNTSGTSNPASIGFINTNYLPLYDQYSDIIIEDGVQQYPYIYCYGVVHNKGTIMARLEHNTIQGVTKWRVMLINNSSTDKPDINGQIMYPYIL